MLKSAGMSQQPPAGSYGTIFGDIRASVRTYIAKQLLLPRQEIGELVRTNIAAVKWVAVGAVFMLLFLIALVALLIAVLGIWLQPWAAAGIVALVFLVIGALLVFIGTRKFEVHGPERTMRSVRETISWVKATLLGRSAS
jgi:hypothetical protein